MRLFNWLGNYLWYDCLLLFYVPVKLFIFLQGLPEPLPRLTEAGQVPPRRLWLHSRRNRCNRERAERIELSDYSWGADGLPLPA